jgi:hypothetical protein
MSELSRSNSQESNGNGSGNQVLSSVASPCFDNNVILAPSQFVSTSAYIHEILVSNPMKEAYKCYCSTDK